MFLRTVSLTRALYLPLVTTLTQISGASSGEPLSRTSGGKALNLEEAITSSCIA